MPGCHCCDATAKTFDAKVARQDLKRFRRRGPDGSTREILSGLQSFSVPPSATLLDIGGGVGVIHHVLLERQFSRAIHVDASPAYAAAAREEAARLEHTDRVSFEIGDFAELAETIPPADLVTLDRVVCCYPDYARMLGAAAAHARRLLALSYPRPRLLARLVVAIGNAWRRIAGNMFRSYIHPPAGMNALLAQAGMKRVWSGGTWIWAVEIYERSLT